MDAVKHQLPTVLGLSQRTKQDKADAQAKDKQSHALLRSLRSRSRANRECCDCTAQLTGWASLPHGVFLCIDCAQVHRNLGRHMAQVKAFSTGTYLWYDDEVDAMRVMGNANANALYASPARGAPQKPDQNASRAEKDVYVRNKYERLRWVDPSWSASSAGGTSSATIRSADADADAATLAARQQKKVLKAKAKRARSPPRGAKAKAGAGAAANRTLQADLWGDWDSAGAGAPKATKATKGVPSLLDQRNVSTVPCLRPAEAPAATGGQARGGSTGCASELRKSGRGGAQDFFAEFGL